MRRENKITMTEKRKRNRFNKINITETTQKKIKVVVLILIFIITLSLRLYLAFKVQSFDLNSYFNLREIKHIRETGRAFFYDSINERFVVFSPVFHYLVAFFSLFMPVGMASKIIPNIFASTFIFVAYLISKKVTNKEVPSLFISFLSGFIPIFFGETFNSISIYTLIIPLMFYNIYCFMNLNKEHSKKYINNFVMTSSILPLIHPISFVLIIGYMVYLLFLRIEGIRQKKLELELILFSTFWFLWVQFMLYRRIIMMHGPQIIIKNIFINEFSRYTQVGILDAINKIGLIPFIYGIYVLYQGIFRGSIKDKNMFVFIGMAISILVFMWLMVVPINTMLIFFASDMVLLFSYIYTVNITGQNKIIKLFSRYKAFFLILFYLTFILTSVGPTIAYAEQKIRDAPRTGEIIALSQMQNKTFVSSPPSGFFINYYSQSKVVADDNIFLVKDSKRILRDISTLYTTISEIEAVSILNKYNATEIYFSNKERNMYGVDKIAYVDDKKCFTPQYINNTIIYGVKCKVVETK